MLRSLALSELRVSPVLNLAELKGYFIERMINSLSSSQVLESALINSTNTSPVLIFRRALPWVCAAAGTIESDRQTARISNSRRAPNFETQFQLFPCCSLQALAWCELLERRPSFTPTGPFILIPIFSIVQTSSKCNKPGQSVQPGVIFRGNWASAGRKDGAGPMTQHLSPINGRNPDDEVSAAERDRADAERLRRES